jgi:hypothetical protein
MKPLPIVLAVFALVIVGAVILILQEPDGPGDADALDGGGAIVASSEDRGGLETELATDERQAIESLVVPLVEELAEVIEEPLPASYKKALGGIIGRVVEEDGTPVTQLTIELLGGGLENVFPPVDALARGGSPELDVERGSAVTDGEGRFHFDELEPRIVGLLVLDPGGPRAMLQLLEETPVSGAVRDLGDIVLPASVTLIGRVVDERSAPLANVRVRATDLQAMILGTGAADWRQDSALLLDIEEGGQEIRMVVEPSPSIARLERLLPFPTTLTNQDGEFVLDGVRPGLVSVILDDAEHQTRVEGPLPTGEAGGTRDLGTLTLLDGLTLRGRVTDEGGEPVPFAQVRAGNQLSVAPVAILRGPIQADAEGRFEVTGLREGLARAVARAESHHEYSPDPGGTHAGGEVTVVLPGRRNLVLDIRDMAGEAITQDVKVFTRYLPVDDAEELPDFVFMPKSRSVEQGVTRDEEDRLVVGDLAPGIWDVLVSTPGYGPVRETHDLTLADVEHVLVLEPARGMALRVVSAADGEPVEHARVSARDLEDDRDDMPQPVTAGRTDSDGKVVLEDLADSNYSLEISHPAFAVRTMEVTLPLPEQEDGVPGEGEVLVELSTGGTIIGTLTENGAPPVNRLMLTLSRQDDIESSAVMPRMTLMAADGSFAFHDVDPGEVRIEARERIELSSLMSWWEPFAMTPHAREDLFVQADQEVEVVLVVGSTWADVPTGFVEGRLTVNGFPAEAWKIRTWGEIRRTVTTGPDGRFTMGQLAADDEVVLLVNSPGQAMMEGTVDSYVFALTEGQREFADIQIQTGSVSGQIWSDLDGRPIEGVAVSLEVMDDDKQGGWWGRRGGAAVTDALGEFHFDIVSEGRYAVSAEADGYASARSEVFTVSGLREVRGIELRLAEPVRITGRVVYEGLEEEPTWAWLNATTERGERSGARIDVDTNTYVFDDLMSDRTWTVSCYTNTGEELQPVDIYVRGDEDDVVLVFAPVPELDDEMLDQLEALGYATEGIAEPSTDGK